MTVQDLFYCNHIFPDHSGLLLLLLSSREKNIFEDQTVAGRIFMQLKHSGLIPHRMVVVFRIVSAKVGKLSLPTTPWI